jgi:hypothetical protein
MNRVFTPVVLMSLLAISTRLPSVTTVRAFIPVVQTPQLAILILSQGATDSTVFNPTSHLIALANA